MKIKPVVLLLSLVVMALHGLSQLPEIDQLLKTVKKTSGKDKINALADLSKKFYSIDPHKGIEYGKEALHIADSLKIPSLKSKVYNSIGVNFWALSDFSTARLYYDSAFANAVTFHDSLEIGISYNRRGLIYESLGHFDSALMVFHKEADICRKLKNPERLGTVLENIGTIYMHRGEFTSSITYLIEAKSIFEQNKLEKSLPYIYLKLGRIYSETKDYAIAENWLNKGINGALAQKDLVKAAMGMNAIGILYKNQEKFGQALVKFEQALTTIQTVKNIHLKMAIYDNIGSVYSSEKKYHDALKYHKKSADLAIQLNNPVAMAINQVNMGIDYYHLKNYRNARICYEKALPVFKSSNSKSDLLATYKSLLDITNETGDYKQSVEYYQSYIEINDSLVREELGTALDSLKIKFHTEQTNIENRLLKQETELQQKKIFLQRMVMFSVAGFLILLAILTILIIINRRRIKNANHLLELKNQEISEKVGELSLINKQLTELSAFRDTMISFLIHDLKNSLNRIINIDVWKNADQQVAVAKQTGKQMLNLVMNLLDISRYENKTMKISVKEIPITQLINNAYNEVSYLAEQKSIYTKVNCPVDFIVKADPELIERVFVNLFSNAIKYSSIGDSILVQTEGINHTGVKIMVQDHGEGIDPEYLPVIFDKFTPAREKKSGLARSTGIGLAFCKAAIESHGGKIGVDSIAGQGATFWFTLLLAGYRKDPTIHSMGAEKSYNKFLDLHLSKAEIKQLTPFCDMLKTLSIYQISDVKDIVHDIDIHGSANIAKWKSFLLKALSDCNQIRFKELIKLASDDKI